MKWIFKHKIEVAIFLVIIAIYFLLRLPNLTAQPIFADEAIYIRWAQVMRAEPSLRFLPLSDGKAPLFMWSMMPLLKLFPDPLFAGRILSVFSGFATLLGVFFLGWKFFNLRIGLWGSFLLSITPYMVFFDRMALVDSMLAAFVIWSLILALWLIKNMRLDLAMFLGYLLGGGLLTKTPGMLAILSLPLTLITFNWSNKKRTNSLLKLIGLFFVAVVIAMIMYNILRLGPGFSNLSTRNQDYVFSPLRLINSPLDPFLPHLGDLADWFPKFLTWPTLFLVLGAVILLVVQKNRLALTILLWSALPLIIQMSLLKTFTARYLLFSIPPLLLLAAFFIDYLTRIKIKRQFWVSLIIILILLPQALQFNINLLQNPHNVALPKSEKKGYFEDWTAGYGLSEIAQFLIGQSKDKKIIVGTDEAFGTLPDGLWIYLDKASNISFVDRDAYKSGKLQMAAKSFPTFYVANKSKLFWGTQDLKLIKEYPKATSGQIPQDAMMIFQVVPY